MNLEPGGINALDPLIRVTQVGCSPNSPLSMRRYTDDELRELITGLRSKIMVLESKIEYMEDPEDPDSWAY